MWQVHLHPPWKHQKLLNQCTTMVMYTPLDQQRGPLVNEMPQLRVSGPLTIHDHSSDSTKGPVLSYSFSGQQICSWRLSSWLRGTASGNSLRLSTSSYTGDWLCIFNTHSKVLGIPWVWVSCVIIGFPLVSQTFGLLNVCHSIKGTFYSCLSLDKQLCLEEEK